MVVVVVVTPFALKQAYRGRARPSAAASYTLRLRIGRERNSGSAAGLRLRLFGSHGLTRMHSHRPPQRLRDGEDYDVPLHDVDVGNVLALAFGHDNSGGDHPSLRVEMAYLYHHEMQHVWEVPFFCWFSTRRDDFAVMRVRYAYQLKLPPPPTADDRHGSWYPRRPRS